MANRPTFIDLRANSHNAFGSGPLSPRLPSPRLHVAGDIPPDLSPLDAFAAQSRLLARQLEQQSNEDGKRMSRLPPLGLATALGVRPGVIRSASASEATASADDTFLSSSDGLGFMTEVEQPAAFRPTSVYPRMSGLGPFDRPEATAEALPQHNTSNIYDEEQFRGRKPTKFADGHGPSLFGARREESPGSIHREPLRSPKEAKSLPQLQHHRGSEYMAPSGQPSRRNLDGSAAGGGPHSSGLAPPRGPFAQRQQSTSSMSTASEYESTGFSSSNLQQPRRLSSGSGISNSPISPVMYYEARSPSISSEISVGGTRLPRPAFNFSRPLSRASLPPVEVPSRQASEDSQPSFMLADDTAHTPVSMHSEGFPDTPNDNSAAPSYVYSRFSLPRGKVLQRNSLIFQEGPPQAQSQSEQPHPFDAGQAPPSPPLRPSTSSNARPSLDPGRPSLDPSRASNERSRSTDGRGRSRSSGEQFRPSNLHAPARFAEISSGASTAPSMASDSTIRARRSMHSLAPSAELSAEEHVAKAIKLHEQGALNESTYNLRLAARQNHPTGMLLYALACRHGWGMRPNQREGVHWLRKAADFTGLEIADDEETRKDGKPIDFLDEKTRKAQFALSIYELGVSHMNGWGIEQDKVLALRCFEIAGSWGDADALVEAGFCYAQGVGCKKDLKKSAKFYRQAEEKGISMVGNSWIYKAKYADPDEKSSGGSPDKKRNKSKSRTMFGRKNRAHNND